MNGNYIAAMNCNFRWLCRGLSKFNSVSLVNFEIKLFESIRRKICTYKGTAKSQMSEMYN